MFNSTPVSLYPVPADAQGSVQHVTLNGVPVNVLPKLWSWFSQVKQLECHRICPPQEVQCVHMRDDCEEPPKGSHELSILPLLLPPIERVLLGHWW